MIGIGRRERNERYDYWITHDFGDGFGTVRFRISIWAANSEAATRIAAEIGFKNHWLLVR